MGFLLCSPEQPLTIILPWSPKYWIWCVPPHLSSDLKNMVYHYYPYSPYFQEPGSAFSSLVVTAHTDQYLFLQGIPLIVYLSTFTCLQFLVGLVLSLALHFTVCCASELQPSVAPQALAERLYLCKSQCQFIRTDT